MRSVATQPPCNGPTDFGEHRASARSDLGPAVTAARRVPLATPERFAFFGLVAQLVFTLAIVPVSPFGHIVEPIYLAAVSSSTITVVLMVLRLRTKRNIRVEKLLLAMFLGAMPVIYSLTAMRDGASGDVLALEMSAIAVFGALAVIGFNGSPWFLVIGIAGHGLLWDGSHHAAHLVVPGWYAVFCLVVDVMLAAYVATQIRAYSR